MIHIVFQAADVETLQKAMELDESLQGSLVLIKDDYAIGPLAEWQERRDWWKMVLAIPVVEETEEAPLPMSEDKMTLHHLKTTLDENETEEAWIWMAQNAHDVSGYYWLMSQLSAYQGRVQVLYLNNLPFLNEKGNIFYPTALYEIQPSEFRKAKKLARPITLSEFEIDPDEWTKTTQENAGIRLLEGGKKLAGAAYEYYDKDLLAALTGNWQKMHRLITNVTNRQKIRVGDAFLAWRLRELVALGSVQLNGDPAKGWNACEVKAPGGPVDAQTTEEV